MLSGRFEFLHQIRKRGAIASFLARDLDDATGGAVVVLNVLQDPRAQASQIELFKLEAEAAAGLSHRNILRSHPSEEIDGVHFSITEHRPAAETLRDLLDRQGWLDISLAIGIVRQIADALEYAHSSGILHLAIHPGSILIVPDGTALLADFGLEARSELAWAHQERSIYCPVHYISPEQASGKPIDSRSDFYSLGVVLYQMLTDRLPLDSIDPEAVRQKHLTQSPPFAHLYLNDIPYSVSNIITRMLEKDPAKRFADAASLREALDSSLNEIIGGCEDVLLPLVEEYGERENTPDWREYESPDASDKLVDAYAFDQSVILAIAQMSDSSEQPFVPPVTVTATAAEPESPPVEKAGAERASSAPLSAPRFINSSAPELSAVTGVRWQPLFLVFAVAIAVVIGLIGLALADRSKNSLPLLSGAPATDGKLNRAPSSQVTESQKTPADNQPIGSGHSVESNSAKTGFAIAGPAAVTSSPLRSIQRRVTRSAASQRPAMTKRKVRRGARPAVRYRAGNRSHYRARER